MLKLKCEQGFKKKTTKKNPQPQNLSRVKAPYWLKKTKSNVKILKYFLLTKLDIEQNRATAYFSFIVAEDNLSWACETV